MAKLQKVSTLDSSERPPKGIYILPNLFTTASLFAAFYAIIQSTVGNFENAAIAVIIAAVLDSLDGRVARMTNTVSDFGKEYDSLVDLVAFGLAPALILFEWGLKDLGKVGWLTAFIYVATTALRLARFNTQDSPSKRYFQGLPCPAAAVLLAAGIWTAATYNVTGGLYTIVGLGTMFLLSMAMVSPLPYRSFKDLDLKHRVPFMAVLGLVLVFVLISFDPPRVLLVAFSSYAVSGLIVWGLLRRSGEQVFGQKDVKSPEELEGDPIVSGENASGRVNRP